MELPRRARGDELLKAGELLQLRQRLRNISRKHDLTSVIACAFDHRTRMLPFVYADIRMAPAGVRAIGAAMLDCGFNRTRIVLQQWNKNFRPSQMRLEGNLPDLFMVSSMQIHSAQAETLLRDACRIDPAHRPLIIVGGPKAIYEPWSAFGTNPLDPWAADVAITGEEHVLLSLLEILLSTRAVDESLRSTFIRVRNGGILDQLPGLVYARTDRNGLAQELVDTGVQRLLSDLDELPHPTLGYQLLEPPSGKATLAFHALPTDRVRKYSPISSLVITSGCKFACHYCPIPAYNQRQYRTKSGLRIAAEISQLHRDYGLHYFFGADDNFFNNKKRTLEIVETLARSEIEGVPLRKKIRWGTEATVLDTLAMKDHLRTVRQSGLRALWLGVEDVTGTLIDKGQTVDKTKKAFGLLVDSGICPMPMIMHHDTQPLVTFGLQPHGLLNQARLLRKAGAISLQVLMISPATGSRSYSETFTSGLVYRTVAGKDVQPHMLDANYVIASAHKQPWKKQLNLIVAYLYFYNPIRLAIAVARPKSRLYLADAGAQLLGMWGLLKTIRRTIGWVFLLMRGNIVRQNTPPTNLILMRGANGDSASHALPSSLRATPTAPDSYPLGKTANKSMPNGGTSHSQVNHPHP